MDDHDHMITAYRYHGTVVARGCPPEKAFAELFGKSTGVGHGKGGSMHMTMRDKNFYGGHGIVGAQVPLGTGLAFGIKYEGKKEVSITMFGDGAINQGQVAEAANMAKLWDLPVIYVCENNLYGMGTPYDKASSNPLLYTKLHPIPGIRLDGQNVLAVREHMRFARNWCVSGKGPIMLELMTYRFHGHSVSDSGLGYRTRQEVEKMRRERDPITLLKNLILERGAGTEEELKAIEKEIKQLIEKAAETARNDPMPDPQKDLFTDIHGTPYDDSKKRLLTPRCSVHPPHRVRQQRLPQGLLPQ